jgi:hypothetical protein
LVDEECRVFKAVFEVCGFNSIRKSICRLWTVHSGHLKGPREQARKGFVKMLCTRSGNTKVCKALLQGIVIMHCSSPFPMGVPRKGMHRSQTHPRGSFPSGLSFWNAGYVPRKRIQDCYIDTIALSSTILVMGLTRGGP